MPSHVEHDLLGDASDGRLKAASSRRFFAVSLAFLDVRRTILVLRRRSIVLLSADLLKRQDLLRLVHYKPLREFA